MLRDDENLVQWANQGLRPKVTLGQLLTLLELLGSESVAAMGSRGVSQAVNYRQKLDRLESALAIGRLTKRVGGATQVSDLGQQVAGEVRLLLRELRAIEHSPVDGYTWLIGAGDAWLQSVVVPCLASIKSSKPNFCWEVRNLRMAETVRALKEGRLHFGFVREADLRGEDGLDKIQVYEGNTFSILAGQAAQAPSEPLGLLHWLRDQGRPLVQQGTSWKPLSEQLESQLQTGSLLAGLAPSVVCETHTQAASAATHSGSWCIVPTKVAQLFVTDAAQSVEVGHGDHKNNMALVTYGRHTGKLATFPNATKLLKKALDASMCSSSWKMENRLLPKRDSKRG